MSVLTFSPQMENIILVQTAVEMEEERSCAFVCIAGTLPNMKATKFKRETRGEAQAIVTVVVLIVSIHSPSARTMALNRSLSWQLRRRKNKKFILTSDPCFTSTSTRKWMKIKFIAKFKNIWAQHLLTFVNTVFSISGSSPSYWRKKSFEKKKNLYYISFWPKITPSKKCSSDSLPTLVSSSASPNS